MLRPLLMVAVVLAGSAVAKAEEPPRAETPRQAIDAMVALLEKDDLKTLLLERYGELDRFAKTDQEKLKIVEQMVPKFGKFKPQLLETFKKAKDLEPELTTERDEKVAVYTVGTMKMRLYLKNGKWTFHL